MDANSTKDALIRQQALRNTASNVAGKCIALGTWFFLTPFMLHQLGTTNYGLWTLVASTVAYGSLLDLGIAGAVIKYVAEYRARADIDQARALVATALSLYSLLGLVAIVLSMALAPAFPSIFNIPSEHHSTAVWLVRLMGIGIGISIPCATAGAVLRGLQRYDISNVIGVIGTLGAAMASVVVLLLNGGVIGIVAVNIVATLVTQVISVWSIKRIAPELHFGWRNARWSLVKTVLTFSSSLFVIDVAGRLQTRTDEIVIAAVLLISAVTPYAIARKLSELGQILTDQFLKILLPLASSLQAENDQARLRGLYTTGTRLTLAIFVPITGILILLAHPILTVWVGAEYADSAWLVAVLTLANLIGTSQWPGGSILQGMARHRLLAISSLLTGLANLGLSILLASRFGLIGVALGTLITTIVESFGFVLPYTLRVLGISATRATKEIFLPVLLPAVPMLAVLYILRELNAATSLLSIALVSMVSVLVYVVGYISIGAGAGERQAYTSVVLNTVRFASEHFKRS